MASVWSRHSILIFWGVVLLVVAIILGCSATHVAHADGLVTGVGKGSSVDDVMVTLAMLSKHGEGPLESHLLGFVSDLWNWGEGIVLAIVYCWELLSDYSRSGSYEWQSLELALVISQKTSWTIFTVDPGMAYLITADNIFAPKKQIPICPDIRALRIPVLAGIESHTQRDWHMLTRGRDKLNCQIHISADTCCLCLTTVAGRSTGSDGILADGPVDCQTRNNATR